MPLCKHRPAPKNRAEVKHVVFDPRASPRHLEHVEAVDTPGVVVVQPGAKDARRAQLAPMLVGNYIVWIVGARSVVAKVAKRLSTREPAHEHTIPAVWQPRRAVEDGVEIVLLQAAPSSIERIANRGIL